MKHKRSYKVLWNVFLYVICGGSLIYGFVQQRRMVEARVQVQECQQRADSLKAEVEKMNAQMKVALKQLQIETSAGLAAMNDSRK
jgi:hypothetical protein